MSYRGTTRAGAESIDVSPRRPDRGGTLRSTGTAGINDGVAAWDTASSSSYRTALAVTSKRLASTPAVHSSSPRRSASPALQSTSGAPLLRYPTGMAGAVLHHQNVMSAAAASNASLHTSVTAGPVSHYRVQSNGRPMVSPPRLSTVASMVPSTRHAASSPVYSPNYTETALQREERFQVALAKAHRFLSSQPRRPAVDASVSHRHTPNVSTSSTLKGSHQQASLLAEVHSPSPKVPEALRVDVGEGARGSLFQDARTPPATLRQSASAERGLATAVMSPPTILGTWAPPASFQPRFPPPNPPRTVSPPRRVLVGAKEHPIPQPQPRAGGSGVVDSTSSAGDAVELAPTPIVVSPRWTRLAAENLVLRVSDRLDAAALALEAGVLDLQESERDREMHRPRRETVQSVGTSPTTLWFTTDSGTQTDPARNRQLAPPEQPTVRLSRLPEENRESADFPQQIASAETRPLWSPIKADRVVPPTAIPLGRASAAAARPLSPTNAPPLDPVRRPVVSPAATWSSFPGLSPRRPHVSPGRAHVVDPPRRSVAFSLPLSPSKREPLHAPLPEVNRGEEALPPFPHDRDGTLQLEQLLRHRERELADSIAARSTAARREEPIATFDGPSDRDDSSFVASLRSLARYDREVRDVSPNRSAVTASAAALVAERLRVSGDNRSATPAATVARGRRSDSTMILALGREAPQPPLVKRDDSPSVRAWASRGRVQEPDL